MPNPVRKTQQTRPGANLPGSNRERLANQIDSQGGARKNSQTMRQNNAGFNTNARQALEEAFASAKRKKKW